MRKSRRYMVMALTLTLTASLLSGCQKDTTKKRVQLKDSAKLVMSDYEVGKSDIYDMSTFKGYVGGEVCGVSFENEGAVQDWFVHLGDKVKKGDVLCAQNKDEALQESKSLSIAYRAKIKQAKVMNDEAQKSIDESKKRMDAAKNKEKEYVKVEWQKAKEILRFQKKQQKREIAEAKAACEKKTEEIENMTLYAPCDGVVTYCKDINEETWQGETQAIVTDTSKLVVKLDIMEYSTFLKENYSDLVGLTGDLKIPLEAGKYDRDTIRYAVSNNQSLTAFLTAKEPDKLPLGSTVMVEGKSNVAKNVLNIPPECLNTTDNEVYVYKMIDGEPVKTVVTVGVRTKNAVEIKEGLQEGDKVQCPSDVSISPDLGKYEVKDEEYIAKTLIKDVAYVYPITKKIMLPYTDARLTKLNHKQNDHVKKGDTVLEYTLAGSPALVLDLEEQLRNAIAEGGDMDNPEAERIRNEIAKAKESIGHKELKAPFDARIVTLPDKTNLNRLLSPDNTVAELECDSYGVFRIPDEEGVCHVGEACNIVTFDGQNVLPAHVVRSAWDYYEQGIRIYSEGANYFAYVKLDEPAPKGVSLTDARLEMNYIRHSHACVIPSKALYVYDGRYYVWSFEDGQFVRRYVSPGFGQNMQVWVAEGIEPGMKLGVGAENVADLELDYQEQRDNNRISQTVMDEGTTEEIEMEG